MALTVNRRGAISFHDVDHGDGRGAEQGGCAGVAQWPAEAEALTTPRAVWLHPTRARAGLSNR